MRVFPALKTILSVIAFRCIWCAAAKHFGCAAVIRASTIVVRATYIVIGSYPHCCQKCRHFCRKRLQSP